jgi:hypothetical protein
MAYPHSNKLVVKDDPRQQIYKSHSTGKKTHDDCNIQSLDGEDDEVIREHPKEREEGTPSQKLERSHPLSHQVVQALPDVIVIT